MSGAGEAMRDNQIEVLADRILRAAGSSLKNYEMHGTREAILEATRGAYMAGWIAFGEAMKKELKQ